MERCQGRNVQNEKRASISSRQKQSRVSCTAARLAAGVCVIKADKRLDGDSQMLRSEG
jgi:hypothetical protein